MAVNGKGRTVYAVTKRRGVLPLLAAFFAQANPGPLKEALAMIALPSAHALPPLRPPSEATMAKLPPALDGLRACVDAPCGSRWMSWA